jgi:hypothetical protein
MCGGEGRSWSSQRSVVLSGHLRSRPVGSPIPRIIRLRGHGLTWRLARCSSAIAVSGSQASSLGFLHAALPSAPCVSTKSLFPPRHGLTLRAVQQNPMCNLKVTQFGFFGPNDLGGLAAHADEEDNVLCSAGIWRREIFHLLAV